jgi:hypothetical protein
MANTVGEAQPAEFLRQLSELGRLYGELADLTRAQCEAGDEYANIAGILERKQELMRGIEAVGLDLAGLRERWAEVREGLPEEQRSGVAGEIKALQATLREVVEMENHWHEKIASRKEETLNQIRKLQGGRRIARAYGHAAREAQSRFLDQTE